jgi:hypothetical protein
MIVLRNKQTHLYYAAVGGWSPDPQKALTFPDILRARAFTETMGLVHVEIVLKSEHGESIIPLPVFPIVAISH